MKRLTLVILLGFALSVTGCRSATDAGNNPTFQPGYTAPAGSYGPSSVGNNFTDSQILSFRTSQLLFATGMYCGRQFLGTFEEDLSYCREINTAIGDSTGQPVEAFFERLMTTSQSYCQDEELENPGPTEQRLLMKKMHCTLVDFFRRAATTAGGEGAETGTN